MKHSACILCMVLGIFIIKTCQCYAENHSPLAARGELDLSQWNFNTQGPVPLDGKWEFYYKQFISPKTFANKNSHAPEFISVPGVWNDRGDDNSKYISQGHGTYRLVVHLPDQTDSLLSIQFHTIGTAFTCYVNNRIIARAGKIGTSKETTEPSYAPQVVLLTPPYSSTLEIVIHVSNFHHRFSGIWESIHIGNEKDIRDTREKHLTFNAFLFGISFVMGFYHFGLFLLRRSDPSPLYFGIFCFLVSARIAVTGEQYLSYLYPEISWELLRKIEFIGVYFGIPVFCRFIHSVFPKEFSNKFLTLLTWLCIPMALLAIVTTVQIYSFGLLPSQIIMVITAIYILIISIQAVIRKRDGANFFLMGIIFFTITIFNDILYANMLVSTGYWVPLGLFVFILCQTIILSIRFSKAFIKIEELSNNLGRIVENAPIGIFQITPQGSYITANPELAKIYGHETPEDLIRHSKQFQTNHPKNPDGYQSFMEIIEGKSFLQNIETKHVRKDGDIIDVSISAYAIRNDKGQIAFYEGMLDDVTEKKRAVALEIAKKSAEDANRTKSDFLANMSHEIRTPMNGIIGMNSLLLDTALTPEQREFAEIVRFSSESLLVLLNDILDFSKIESGKMDMEIIDFDLRKTVEEIAELMVIKAEEKGLAFGFLIHHEVPSLIQGDPTRLRQILLNLSGNSLKFTDKGSVFIQVVLEEETQTSLCLKFSVQDTGIGISDKQKKQLFQKFSQADTSTTRKYGGTGLGLCISQKLVEMMGGTIDVESQPEKGSVFYFTAWFKKQAHETVSFLPVEIQDKKILIVDNASISIEILSAYLKQIGCCYDIAADEPTAIEKLSHAHRPYHAVIIDERLSAERGDNLGNLIQTDRRFHDLKLIMISSRALQKEAKKAENIGFHAFLTKPIKQAQLHDCLKAVFGYKQPKEAKSNKPFFITKHRLDASKRKQVRILLAEDNKVNQKLALAYLTKFGFQADVVENGRKAIEALEQTHYTLVLMDLQMPEMGGLEATRKIRSQQTTVKNPDIPIIAMTARAMKEDREKCVTAGMNDYISKPINPQRLADKIESFLKENPEK